MWWRESREGENCSEFLSIPFGQSGCTSGAKSNLSLQVSLDVGSELEDILVFVLW